MNKRIERIKKTKIYVDKGFSDLQISSKVGVTESTIRQYKKELESAELILSKNNTKEILLWIIGISIGLFATVYSALYLSGPINLEVWENISSDGRHLNIYAKNHDFFRSTGEIDIYKLEINPNRPHMQLRGNLSLKPREERDLASLSIIANRSSLFTIPGSFRQGISIPAPLAFYITEDTSISYKITCENCKNSGIIRRVPDYTAIIFMLSYDVINDTLKGSVPTYYWEQHELEELFTLEKQETN